MPLSCRLRMSTHAWFRRTGGGATAEDASTIRALFEAVGVIEQVPEYLISAVTGLSGSGPAYIYLIIEGLADGGVRAGLPRATALKLAAQTGALHPVLPQHVP